MIKTPTSKEINSRKEVVRTSATLKARDQLHQDPAGSISDVRLQSKSDESESDVRVMCACRARVMRVMSE